MSRNLCAILNTNKIKKKIEVKTTALTFQISIADPAERLDLYIHILIKGERCLKKNNTLEIVLG